MDNYRELKIRCDPGFGHLPMILWFKVQCLKFKIVAVQSSRIKVNLKIDILNLNP